MRSGTTGRYLDAMRGSEVAAASIGINRNRARIVAFALSAAIAGLGGGLFASYEGAVNSDAHYVPELGLAWIVLVVTLGSRTVEGAINAAVGFIFFQAVVLPTWIPWAVNHVQPVYHMSSLPAGLQPILFGLGALTYAKHPEGILEFQKRRSLARVQRMIDKFKGQRPRWGVRHGRLVGYAGHRRDRRGVRVTLLVAEGVTKRFAGITALNGVGLEVGEAEIVGLIGPNGAGKTTFFNCLLGILKPDGGSVTFEGTDLSRVPTYRRARLGIGRTFQRIELFTGMTRARALPRRRPGAQRQGRALEGPALHGPPDRGRAASARRRCSSSSTSVRSPTARSSR